MASRGPTTHMRCELERERRSSETNRHGLPPEALTFAKDLVMDQVAVAQTAYSGSPGAVPVLFSIVASVKPPASSK